MRTASPVTRLLGGTLAGALVSVLVVMTLGLCSSPTDSRHRLVPEDASGHLRRIAIHYVPAMDRRVLPVWRELFAKLPADIAVAVAVERPQDYARFMTRMREEGVALDRFQPVVVGRQLTTWSRDRMASLDGDRVLAPPRVAAGSGPRAGDWEAPFAIARDVYHVRPAIAELVFEGGDLAASQSFVFADANLIGRNLGRGDATRAHLEDVLRGTFSQEVIWLGDARGDVPEHHIMMYMVPLDDRRALVGDVRLGRQLAPGVTADPATSEHAARFDRVAAQLSERGFAVTRIPVVVLPGAGSYVTYTNALFDRDATGPIVYLPTYRIPALDRAATDSYTALGYRVVPIDVSTVYTLNGSLGCLVNVMART
jgi:peptidyl-arginine deiminase